MMQTIKFRLHPTLLQEKQLREIFTIYNRTKRIGYKLLFKLKDTDFTKTEKRKIVQPRLMELCDNNPYINSILIHNETKLSQQRAWYEKRKKYLNQKFKTINEKIERILQKDKRDRRLKGLYSRLSSVQNRLNTLEIPPVVFGTKQLFRERIRRKIDRAEFRIRRDASFCCVGKKQGVNLNLKVLPDMTLKVRRFSKEKGKKWLRIPFILNYKQEKWFRELLTAEKYTVEIVRRFIKGKLRYFAHISYETPEADITYGFGKGAIGLDFNYNFVTLSNVDKNGTFKSYCKISFRNLHTLRKHSKENYISYKLNKVINYCMNKNKGVVIEDLSLDSKFSYNKMLNRKLSDFRSTALDLLVRKCLRKGIDVRKVYPAYTSIIGKYKYSRSYNLSTHVLASYVIARRGLGFKEAIPAVYMRLLAQVGDMIEPRLKPSSPYYEWSRIHDLFKHSGITSFKTSEIARKALLVKDVLNSATSTQSDNLRAGLSACGKIEDYYKFWNFIKISNVL